jgi:hypothetical protein
LNGLKFLESAKVTEFQTTYACFGLGLKTEKKSQGIAKSRKIKSNITIMFGDFKKFTL